MHKSVVVIAVLVNLGGTWIDAIAADATDPVRKPYGIEKRTLWTTSRIHGTPDPPLPYMTEAAYPNLKFDQPLEMAVVTGTDYRAVSERYGKLYIFPADRQTDTKRLVLDLKRTIIGFAFHPKFRENGYVYVASMPVDQSAYTDGNRLSRFKLNRVNPPGEADLSSEKVILTWQSSGHHGGCVRFGPDGYLYLATGDAGGVADERETGQNITDLLASILRIDIDHSTNGRSYGIPADNPFVDTPGARTEVFSYGLRQPWRFSFDLATGDIWCGDVGQDLWEMVHRIQKGGNYGWSINEGAHPFRPDRKRGPTPVVPPVVEHNHNDFRSITGGNVYHAGRLPELKGTYIYGDYDTGQVWSFRYADGKATHHRQLAESPLRIVSFSQDPAGEVYIVDLVSGRILWLVPNSVPSQTVSDFPSRLSETGLFASTENLEPAPGLIPYAVNSPLYSDNALKQRYIALPGDSQIEFDATTYPGGPGAPPGWRFPDGTVLVKTFLLETEVGNPQSLRRLETRILHHSRRPGNDDDYGAQVWRGYTYLWNDEQTDATLLDAAGLRREYTINDASADGGTRKQTWHFPSRSDCALCHTMAAKYVLGVNTLQMNRDYDYGGVIANQLQTLEHLGTFTKPLPKPASELPKLVDYQDPACSTEQRARAYLHANCSHCHRKWGGGVADFNLLSDLSLAETGVVNKRPGYGTFGVDDPRILAPGNPEHSLLYRRMMLLGLGRMPHVASSVVDRDGAALIRQWIAEMDPATK